MASWNFLFWTKVFFFPDERLHSITRGCHRQGGKERIAGLLLVDFCHFVIVLISLERERSRKEFQWNHAFARIQRKELKITYGWASQMVFDSNDVERRRRTFLLAKGERTKLSFSFAQACHGVVNSNEELQISFKTLNFFRIFAFLLLLFHQHNRLLARHRALSLPHVSFSHCRSFGSRWRKSEERQKKK